MTENSIKVSVTLNNVELLSLRESRIALNKVVNDNYGSKLGDNLRVLEILMDNLANEIAEQTGHTEHFIW